METERDQLRQTYQLCRLGFGLLSLSLILAAIPLVIFLIGMQFRIELFRWFFQSSFNRYLSVPITWGSLVGTYLLWGRWSEPSWQRRVGLLLFMNSMDCLLWFMDQGESLGLRLETVGHEWLRSGLGEALGWAEFALIASLACDLLAHLGVNQAEDAGKATRSLAATGAVIWMIYFIEQTSWHQGWPLMRRGIRNIQSFYLFFGTQMIWALILIQLSALTLAATRQASRVLSEMDQEDREQETFELPAHQDNGLFGLSHEETVREKETTAFGW
ncbi:hypothetical protein [Singulisphaera sp. PoT]|uniref:hypothetical protein n=1 Tax=Singulisphaera sp. PoT TaxID=3411797 RepID=UPI003BF56BEF